MASLKLNNRIALITGASKGLGRAMALALAAEGASLALVARDQEKLEDTAQAARNLGAKAEVFKADVTSEVQVIELEKEVTRRMGRIQILINNAGINVRKPLTDFSLAEWN